MKAATFGDSRFTLPASQPSLSANSEECLFKLWEFAYADLVYNYPPPTSTQSKNGRTWITGLFLYITTLDFVFLKAAP
ncbi:hypothetical protein AAMO2058_001346500 [Amorphochlora amoebiformis]